VPGFLGGIDVKKLLHALLLLGWIPTLVVVSGGRWLTGEPAFAQGAAPVRVTRLYTGTDGKTKVEEYTVPLKASGDPGTFLSETVAATSVQFRRTNQDYFLDWHPASKRQYVVTLSGESEVELDDGRKLRLGPGHILLAEDTTGQGHISRAVGTQDRISIFVALPPDAVAPR
jgi:hypothetical protein